MLRRTRFGCGWTWCGAVKAHVSAILGKLGVADRTQAALLAVRDGLVDS